jgi:NAD+--dinitrogen-reductase ADP-D-ribosyltransferase
VFGVAANVAYGREPCVQIERGYALDLFPSSQADDEPGARSSPGMTFPELADELEGEFARPYHSSNLVNVPARHIGHWRFNDDPLALRIAGVHEFNRSLFVMLDQAETPAEAVEAFETYFDAAFGIEPEQRERCGPRRRVRSSYMSLLRGWGYDSNSPEGAVIKGWVESRFGLLPTHHKEPMSPRAVAVWAAYVAEKMSTRYHADSIHVQLDLLYEFCQWRFRRFEAGKTHITLFRGTNEYDETKVIQQIDRRTAVVQFNNVLSFSDDRDIAGCFGNRILEAQVPVTKILFFNALFPRHPLQAESEHLVIGGEYRVVVRWD